MAFVDFHAAGEAPIVAAAPRDWSRARRPVTVRRWLPRAMATVASAMLAATALVAARFFDDRLLGALSAVLLYAVAAPVVTRLLQAGVRPPRLSYQGMNQTTHRRG